MQPERRAHGDPERRLDQMSGPFLLGRMEVPNRETMRMSCHRKASHGGR